MVMNFGHYSLNIWRDSLHKESVSGRLLTLESLLSDGSKLILIAGAVLHPSKYLITFVIIGVHSWIKIKKKFCGFCVFCGRVKNEVEDILSLLPSSPPMPGKATGASSARDGVGGGAYRVFTFTPFNRGLSRRQVMVSRWAVGRNLMWKSRMCWCGSKSAGFSTDLLVTPMWKLPMSGMVIS